MIAWGRVNWYLNATRVALVNTQNSPKEPPRSFLEEITASCWYLWHILCLIRIGYIRYSSGTRLNTVNDIQVSTYALQFQKKTTGNLVLLESCSQMKLPAVVSSTFRICPLMFVKQSPFKVRK